MKNTVDRRRALALRLLALGCAWLIATGASFAAEPASRSIPEVLDSWKPAVARKKLDQLFQEMARKDEFTGSVVIARNDKILFQGAYGLASREYQVANKVDTQFNLASASKMFTAVAIAQLAEQGKLSFQDPIGKYLGEDWIAPDIGSKVTIEHLLTHTSGLSDFMGTPEFMTYSRTRYKEIKDWQPVVAKTRLTREPGKQWGYCNTNFLLAGVIVEKVSGQSYESYLQEHIFAPAGMQHTGALDLELVNQGYAQGYGKKPLKRPSPPPAPPPGAKRSAGPPSVGDLRGMAVAMAKMQSTAPEALVRNNVFAHVAKGGPAGGLFSTAPDLLKFFNAFTSGKLVSLDTVRLMTTPKPAAPDWGYGMMLTNDGGYGHGGTFEGINTFALMYPGGYRLIVLSNVDSGGFIALGRLYQLTGLAPSEATN